MTTVITPFVTIKCDGPNCNKEVTFEQTQEAQAEAQKEATWLTTMRFVSTLDNRKLGYCSDTCEIEAAGIGTHNVKAARRIITGDDQKVQEAAIAAANAAKAQTALRAGLPVSFEAQQQ